MGPATVAKPKKKSGPKPKPEGPRVALIAMKCRQEYKDWVGRMARIFRTTPSQLIDMALVEFAKNRELDPPPSR